MKYYVVSLVKKDGSYDERYTCLNTDNIEVALRVANNMFESLSLIELDHLLTFDLTYVDDLSQTIQDLLKDGYEPLKDYIGPIRRDRITKHEYLTVCVRDDLNMLPSDSMVGYPRILRTDYEYKIGDIIRPVKYHGLVEYKVLERRVY